MLGWCKEPEISRETILSPMRRWGLSGPRMGVVVGGIVITLITFLTWIFLWKDVYFSSDDLRSSLNGGGGILGRSTPAQVWAAMLNDYVDRNGRIADGVVKAQLTLGYESWQWSSPLILTLLALATWRVLALFSATNDGKSGSVMRLVVYCAVAALPLAMVGAGRGLLGPALFFFNAAVVGYGLGLLLGLAGLLCLAGGVRNPLWLTILRAVAGALCFTLIGVMNESAAIGCLLVLLVLLIFPPSGWGRLLTATMLGGSFLGLALFGFSPGRAARSEQIIGGGESLVLRVGRGVGMLVDTGGWLLLLAVVTSLAMLALVARKTRWVNWAVVIAGSLAWGLLLLIQQDAHPDGVSALVEMLIRQRTLVTAVCAVTALGAVVFLSVRAPARVLRAVARVSAFAVGSALPSLYMGLYVGRPHFFAIYGLLLMPLAIGLAARATASTMSSLTLVTGGIYVAVIVAMAVVGGVMSHERLTEVASVWVPVKRQLEVAAVQAKPGDVIIFPTGEDYTDPDWSKLVPRSKNGGEMLAEWFGVPEGIEVVPRHP